MCGIVAVLDCGGLDSDSLIEQREELVQALRKVRHRGPDFGGVFDDDEVMLGHERLAIVGPEAGAQPLVSAKGTVLTVNGEVYNHQHFRGEAYDYKWQTRSDCEAILHLYETYKPTVDPAAWLPRLDGVYAFVLWDPKEERYIIARDPIGICPLYWGKDNWECTWVASEMKSLVGIVDEIQEFPPGHYYDSGSPEEGPEPFYQPRWAEGYDFVENCGIIPSGVTQGLATAVRKRLMSHVPYGVLLSGGLDSSAVAALMMKMDGGPLNSFAIGLEGSPDLAAARIAADHIGTRHHEVTYTLQEGIDAIPEVIYHLETYDVTTIRAATPLYILARHIRAMGIKMVLTGEGSDEIFGGYLYFHMAPDAKEFYDETIRKLFQLHKFDVLRANKSMAAWGVEARVPFLDPGFLDLIMGIDSEAKMIKDGRIEKQLLRDAMVNLLPDSIRLRQKEQFSDGVGYGWIDGLRDYASQLIDDERFEGAHCDFMVNTPKTKEAYWYRELFEAAFGDEDSTARLIPEGGMSIACSTPTALRWQKEFEENADPSGRAVRGVHKESLI